MNLRFEKKRQVLLGIVIVCVSSFIGIRTVHAAEKPETANNEFVWFNGQQAVTYSISKSISPVVTVALDMFANDIEQVTGI